MSERRTKRVEDCLAPFTSGARKALQTKDYMASGLYPIVDQGQTSICGWTNDQGGVIEEDLPVVVFGDHTRNIKFVDFPFVRGADGTQILKPKSDIDPLFFYFAVRAIHLPSRGYNRHLKALKEKEIWIPDIDEQGEIARSLKVLEETLGLQSEILGTLDRIKRAAMRELFTRGLRGELQKETEIGPTPRSWEVVHVGDCAAAISKGSSPKWQGFTYVDEGVLFVRSKNVGDGVMLWKDQAFLSQQWNEKEPRSILKERDVLVNLVGASIGRCAVGGPEIEGANCNQAVCFIRLDQNRILPGFLCGFLLSPEGQRQIHDSKKDIARANLSLQDVRELLIPEPTMDEQRGVVAILEAIDEKIDLHRGKRDILDNLFEALLHKLMTGEIRVTDLNLSALSATPTTEMAIA